MPVRPILALLGALLCAPAAADEVLAPVERPARIRLFGQNGVSLTMYTNARCEKEYDEEISASGSLSHGFKTLFGKKQENSTIGIPETEATRNLAMRDKLMANPYYLEFPLVPGQPVLLQAQVASASGWRCARDVRAAFVPEPGADYEGEMIRDFDNGICAVSIRRVATDGPPGPIALSSVPRTCDAGAVEAEPLMVMLFEPEIVRYRLAEAGAGIDELYDADDKDSIEDFEEVMAEAPLPAGMALCIVTADAARASPLARRLPALLDARGAQVKLIEASADALQAQWQLTGEQPLTFPLVEYYCRSAAGSRQ
ncbi:hypothetical protein [Pseudoxanthomonas daejeonensis]|uniref:Uncharacterized protein n=1 Tax=Pseudoxanthomonas daejeonensis TaxID=266062 RepID=A0ABQ6Z8K9_9GAMM|nr:hypothetical protein [Pseudoxanthomonas daejeonensis]KAF1695027.1 hypothetical protein CSC65_07355 [Pseudoxanthomonas daejeonensis]